ncbi:hypothetical protein BJ742DRAFT_281480 [Cladochytrium replicatum]|nr:hypothetical protein BJ742DRAFT_281480 [Cladochytrium replicatum]
MPEPGSSEGPKIPPPPAPPLQPKALARVLSVRSDSPVPVEILSSITESAVQNSGSSSYHTAILGFVPDKACLDTHIAVYPGDVLYVYSIEGGWVNGRSISRDPPIDGRFPAACIAQAGSAKPGRVIAGEVLREGDPKLERSMNKFAPPWLDLKENVGTLSDEDFHNLFSKRMSRALRFADKENSSGRNSPKRLSSTKRMSTSPQPYHPQRIPGPIYTVPPPPNFPSQRNPPPPALQPVAPVNPNASQSPIVPVPTAISVRSTALVSASIIDRNSPPPPPSPAVPPPPYVQRANTQLVSYEDAVRRDSQWSYSADVEAESVVTATTSTSKVDSKVSVAGHAGTHGRVQLNDTNPNTMLEADTEAATSAVRKDLATRRRKLILIFVICFVILFGAGVTAYLFLSRSSTPPVPSAQQSAGGSSLLALVPSSATTNNVAPIILTTP